MSGNRETIMRAPHLPVRPRLDRLAPRTVVRTSRVGCWLHIMRWILRKEAKGSSTRSGGALDQVIPRTFSMAPAARDQDPSAKPAFPAVKWNSDVGFVREPSSHQECGCPLRKRKS